jgi:hypothetical protein
LGIISTPKMLKPVRLPQGRARPATRPVATGSSPITATMGIVELAFLPARAELSPPPVIKTSTLRLARSSANAGRRSKRPSAERYSIARFYPST